LNTLYPSRVTWRSEARMRSGAPGDVSATSIRMELLPMSTAAYRGMTNIMVMPALHRRLLGRA
jgi:hypothetical protein